MIEHIPMVSLLTKKIGGLLMMMQARDRRGGDDDERSMRWYEISASVGHLVLAVLLAVGGVGAIVFTYIWDNHKSIVLLQERQGVVFKYIADDVVAMQDRDRRTSQSLSDISHQIEELKIEIVRHMATAQAYQDYSNGNANGLKRRQP